MSDYIGPEPGEFKELNPDADELFNMTQPFACVYHEIMYGRFHADCEDCREVVNHGKVTKERS